MATDKTVLEGLFAGDNRAFSRFDFDNRDLFRKFFLYHVKKSTVDISELYQESLMELWKQIREGRLTKEKLTVDISTYLISIGKNKRHEEIRKQDKYSRLKKGERVFKKREFKSEEEEEENKEAFTLQTKQKQKEVDTNINLDAYKKLKESVERGQEDESESWDVKIARQRYLEYQVKNMEEPCRTIIRDTWWNDMSDKELMEKNPTLYASTNAIKTRRFRCHQKLRTLIRDNDLIKDWCNKQLMN